MHNEEDLVFKALADRNRRRMLDILRDKPGLSVNELAARFEMTRIGVMAHLKVLESAHLVSSRSDDEDARVRRLYLNVVPLQRIHERWTTSFGAQFASGLLGLKRSLEAEPKKGNKE